MSASAPVLRLAILFVLFVCASLIAMNAWRSWEAREAMLRQSEVFGNNLARSLAQHAEDKIKEADTLLRWLVDRIEADGLGPASVARLHPMLMQAVREMPQLHGVFVYDQTGAWIVNSQPVLLTHFNNADRDYFIHHRDHPGDTIFIGPPIRSRSTGDWIITVSRRIDQPDGRFGGVALATLNMRHFNTYYDSLDIGREGSITLAQSDGTLLARHPFNAEVMGVSIAGQALFSGHIAHNDRGSTLLDDDDGAHLHSYRHLERYPLVAVVSRTRAEILADWRADAALHAFVILTLTGGLALAGLYLVHQLRLRVLVEGELRDARDALEAANYALEKLASEDALTGLANRRRFDISLHSEFSRAARHGRPLALILIDVDRFKQYNDTLGHVAGDDCLRRIAQAVQRAGRNRAGDLVARYGGEELAILLPETDTEGARIVAERVRTAVRELAIVHPHSPTGCVTLSAGAHACVPATSGFTPDELVRCADEALYAAKSAGRDRVASHPGP